MLNQPASHRRARKLAHLVLATGLLVSGSALAQGGPCEATEWFMNIYGLNIVVTPDFDVDMRLLFLQDTEEARVRPVVTELQTGDEELLSTVRITSVQQWLSYDHYAVPMAGTSVGNPGRTEAMILVVDETGYFKLPLFPDPSNPDGPFAVPFGAAVQLDETGNIVETRPLMW